MNPGFVHLRLHTEYSLLDSVVRVPELVEATAAAGMPAVAVTDESNLFAMVKFYRAALARGVQPIIGVDLHLKEPGDKLGPTRLALLCQDLEGYRNLTRLVSRAMGAGCDAHATIAKPSPPLGATIVDPVPTRQCSGAGCVAELPRDCGRSRQSAANASPALAELADIAWPSGTSTRFRPHDYRR